MIFCRTDTSDNHHMLALVPATQGAAMPTPDQVGMQHVSLELGNFAKLQEAYRLLKEAGVTVRDTTFHGVTKSVYFEYPDGNRLEVYCNVPPEEYQKSVPNPYSRYGGIEDELEGKISQKSGTVAP